VHHQDFAVDGDIVNYKNSSVHVVTPWDLLAVEQIQCLDFLMPDCLAEVTGNSVLKTTDVKVLALPDEEGEHVNSGR
jgi:hypothetical protein